MANDSYITFDIFKPFEEITCAFSTRKNGFSTGPFSSLNLGNINQDNPEVVKNNRLSYYKSLNIEPTNVILPDQIHSTNVRIVNTPGSIAMTDALISNKTNLFIGIQTADCFPIFLYEPNRQTIGIIHAGWRGAIAGIIRKTIDLMITEFDINILHVLAGVGPGLQKECFEVREDVYQQFSEVYLSKHPDQSKRYLNLQTYIRDCLWETGIQKQNIEFNAACTKCCKSLFYSYRRDGEKSGRMMGIIGNTWLNLIVNYSVDISCIN